MTRMWAKKGCQPKIISAPTQEKVAFNGFVNPETGVLLTTECDMFNYETMIDSVKFFLSKQRKDKKILLILDNAPWHKKAVRLMRENLTEIDGIEFLFLPPYSPELNPIERVWRITRRERTHNRFFETVGILYNTLADYFSKLREPNIKISALCR